MEIIVAILVIAVGILAVAIALILFHTYLMREY